MCKNSNIIIRVSEEEKKKASYLVETLHEKNISSMFRNYINDFYNLCVNTTDKTSLEFYIAKLQDEKRNCKDPYKIYSINQQILILQKLQIKFEKNNN